MPAWLPPMFTAPLPRTTDRRHLYYNLCAALFPEKMALFRGAAQSVMCGRLQLW